MVRRIFKRAVIIIALLSAGSAFIEPKKLPLGILVGGLLGIVNFRGMARSLENLLGTERPAGRLVAMSIFRLFLVSAVIVVLAALRAVNLIGLASGFTVVVVLLVLEGYRTAQRGDASS